jgi:hypothetical protein
MAKLEFVGVIAQQAQPVTRIRGLGGLAYVVGPAQALLAWKHGTAVYLLVNGRPNWVGDERQLARRALGRL